MNTEWLSHLYTIMIPLIIFGILFAYFIIRTTLIGKSKILVQRRRIGTLNICALLLLLCLFISNATFPFALTYLIVPVSIYLAFLSKAKNPVFINEIITVITFVIFIVLWL